MKIYRTIVFAALISTRIAAQEDPTVFLASIPATCWVTETAALIVGLGSLCIVQLCMHRAIQKRTEEEERLLAGEQDADVKVATQKSQRVVCFNNLCLCGTPFLYTALIISLGFLGDCW